jgi:hypothetical protein
MCWMLARPILTLPCISLEDYVFSASGWHKRGGPDFGRGLYLFSRLSWRASFVFSTYNVANCPKLTSR